MGQLMSDMMAGVQSPLALVDARIIPTSEARSARSIRRASPSSQPAAESFARLRAMPYYCPIRAATTAKACRRWGPHQKNWSG